MFLAPWPSGIGLLAPCCALTYPGHSGRLWEIPRCLNRPPLQWIPSPRKHPETSGKMQAQVARATVSSSTSASCGAHTEVTWTDDLSHPKRVSDTSGSHKRHKCHPREAGGMHIHERITKPRISCCQPSGGGGGLMLKQSFLQHLCKCYINTMGQVEQFVTRL